MGEAHRETVMKKACRGMQQLFMVTMAAACGVVAVIFYLDKVSAITLCPYSNPLVIISDTSSSSQSKDMDSFVPNILEGNVTGYDTDVQLGNRDMVGLTKTTQGCDYAVGRWIKGENVPLYSGNTCRRWLSGWWACRTVPARPDFEYESYRWQPDGCHMPRFSSQAFLSRMHNKVVVFVGDSIGRQQYQSLMCMLTGGDDAALVEDVSKLYGLAKPRGAVRAEGTAQRFIESNTTVIHYWSATLCEVRALNKTDPNTSYALHLDQPTWFIQKYLNVMDVLVLNTGHHWNRGKMAANKWIMYVDGKPSNASFLRNMRALRDFTVHRVVTWLHNKKQNNATRAQIFVRSLSPRHFYGGEWNSGGRCDSDLIPVESKVITGPAALDADVENAVMGRDVHLLNVTYLSKFRDDAHISKYRPNQSRQDCLHWCLPGVPDVWNEILYAKLISMDEHDIE